MSGTTNSKNLTLGFDYTSGAKLSTRTISNSAYAYTPSASASDSYNGLNQFTTSGFAYGDGRGNLTSDGSRNFAYDLENRLTASSIVYNAMMLLIRPTAHYGVCLRHPDGGFRHPGAVRRAAVCQIFGSRAQPDKIRAAGSDRRPVKRRVMLFLDEKTKAAARQHRTSPGNQDGNHQKHPAHGRFRMGQTGLPRYTLGHITRRPTLIYI